MPTQPPGQTIGTPRYFAVQPNARNTTKVSRPVWRERNVWRGRPARVLDSRNYSQINAAHLGLAGAEFSPRGERIAHPP